MSLLLLFYSGTEMQAQAQDFQGVRDLVKRRAPWLDKALVLRQTEYTGDNEGFSLSGGGGKIIVQANTPSAAATGVNWYLKYYCHRSLSHMGDYMEPVKRLPAIDTPLHINGLAQYRYALNYCTYNYTMSFYNWDDWQKELDYMALNGVNLMLIANGQEAVWQSVLDQLGYSQPEINAFITGPAFNAWWLMGNIQGWGGPMTRLEIAGRAQLVQQMIKRMHDLGIEPVMPAFFGMVPSSLKDKLTAHIVPQGQWGAFERPDILDPSDTLFTRISQLFYGATRRLYGKDLHFFSGDPFHEGGKHGDIDVKQAGVRIQQAMQVDFPGSTWVLQGWQANPDKNLIAGLDKNKVLIQELFGENTKNWEDRKGYEGTPFIWCTVTNFGERPGINGKLQRFADEIYRVRHSPYAGLCKGVGIMPEGINNNPVVYQLLLELGWHGEKVDVSKWIKGYILSRYGKTDGSMQEAWTYLLKTVYSSPSAYAEGPPENILCARPALKIKSVSSWGSATKKYDVEVFKKAVDLYVKAWPGYKNLKTYRIDLIDLLMQSLASEADTTYAALITAFHKKDLVVFNQQAAKFLSLFDYSEKLLSTEPFYQLSTYVNQALALNPDPALAKNNVLNLLMLNTYWGGNDPNNDALHEYAYKQWAPMMETFYKPRWEMFFSTLRADLAGHTSDSTPVAPVSYFKWDRDWVQKTLAEIMEPASKPQKPITNPTELGILAKRILASLSY